MQGGRVWQVEVLFKPKVIRAVRNLAGLCVVVVVVLIAIWLGRK